MNLVYGAIIISSVLLFSFLYNDNNQAIIQSINLRFFEQKQLFNDVLQIQYDAVKSLQRQARTFINQPFRDNNPDIKLITNPHNHNFYLDVQPEDYDSYVSLIGNSDLQNLSPQLWQEISMGFRLSSLMAILKNGVDSIDCLHYTSKQQFITTYPYYHTTQKIFDSTIYNQEFYQRSLPKNNREDKFFWTDLYFNSHKKAFMITGAAPVYGGTDFKGVISIDFITNSFDKFFKSLSYRFGTLYVVNEFNTVIGGSGPLKTDGTSPLKIHQVLPDDLNYKNILKADNNTLKRLDNYWVIVAETNFAPWKMIFFCHNTDIIFYTLRHILPSLILALVITTIFLIFADRLVAREFIAPANVLVKHITQEVIFTDENIIETKEPWRTWHYTVKNVFDKNHDLVDKLETQISQLDEKVAIRTKDLYKKNKLLEKAVDELKKAQDQIITQEKLAGLGALTAGIAHEIRNPLNFIINFTETSKLFCRELMIIFKPHFKKLPIDQRQDVFELTSDLIQNMDRIYDHGKRADLIVRGMLSHARGGEDVLEYKDINALLQENLTLALAGYNSRNFIPQVIASYDETIPQTKLYAQNLGRVFLNIFNNACYALYEKYHQVVDLDVAPLIRVTSHHDGENIFITIEDNGPGMPKSVRQKIFNPFFTTKPTGEGTGLGLSLSYEIIVNQHRGQFDVTSQVGHATVFKISLPLVE